MSGHTQLSLNLRNPTGHRHRVRVAPEVVRAFAAGPDGLEIVAVGGPKPEGLDGETAPVTWPE